MDQVMIVLLFWLGSAVVTSYIAGLKNRDRGTWFVIGLATALAGVIAVMLVKPRPEGPVNYWREPGQQGRGVFPS